MGPATPHAGKGVAKSRATDAVTDTLMRCRSAQRRFRNTLLFVAADEALLATAREVMRKAMAWQSICDDKRLQDQLTQAQIADTQDKAKTSRDGAAKAVRLAWSHILFPVKAAAAGHGVRFGPPVDLLQGSRRHPGGRLREGGAAGRRHRKGAARTGRAGACTSSRYGPRTGPHLGISEVADWFASYAYLPKLRDRVVLEGAIRDAVGKLDPSFGYADRFDEGTGTYSGLAWAKAPPEIFPPTAVLVRSETAAAQTRPKITDTTITGSSGQEDESQQTSPGAAVHAKLHKPSRFFGAVELDMVRPVKAFDAVLNAVVMELQLTQGAKVRVTVEIEAEAESGFDEADVGIVRDNARQLKFRADLTGFE